MRDAIIFTGMLLILAVVLYASFRCRLIFARIGFVISAAAICIGLAYFGWQPLSGGSHSVDTYFGSVILCLGLLGFCLFGAIEEIWRRLIARPEQVKEDVTAKHS